MSETAWFILVLVLAAAGIGMFIRNVFYARDGWRMQKDIERQMASHSASALHQNALLDEFGELQKRKKELRVRLANEPSIFITNELTKVNGNLLRVVRELLTLPHGEPLTGILNTVKSGLIAEGANV